MLTLFFYVINIQLLHPRDCAMHNEFMYSKRKVFYVYIISPSMMSNQNDFHNYFFILFRTFIKFQLSSLKQCLYSIVSLDNFLLKIDFTMIEENSLQNI